MLRKKNENITCNIKDTIVAVKIKYMMPPDSLILMSPDVGFEIEMSRLSKLW